MINNYKEHKVQENGINSYQSTGFWYQFKWSDQVWASMIDRVLVYDDGKMKFIFKSGSEIKV